MALVLELKKTQKTAPLRVPSSVIGREETCDVVIDDPSVSRRHCAVHLEGAGFVIEDLGSRNGTELDGVKLKPGTRVALKAGSELTIGNVPCTVKEAMVPAKKAPKPPPQLETQAFGIEDLIQKKPSESMMDATIGQVLFKAQQALYPGQPIETLIDSLLRLVLEFIPAGRASAQLISAETGELEPSLTLDHKGEELAATKDFLMSQGVRDKVLSDRKCVLIRDVANDAEFKSRKSLVGAGITSAIAAPIFDGGDVLGILYTDIREGTYELHEEEATIVSLLASFGGTMLSAAHMVTALMASEAALREENEALRQQLATGK